MCSRWWRAADGTGGLAAQAAVCALGHGAAAQPQARVAPPVQGLGHGDAEDRPRPQRALELREPGEAVAHAVHRLAERAPTADAPDAGLEAGRRPDAEAQDTHARR